ncbi:glycosyltransferase family A protein [Streptomyces sp. NPDC002785]|uniref:glycosyltransferase family 2 protein n=1 Tax=Streptomyces sp. NPDC002785 TaxID=3154543 RepID=UPI00332E5599
MDAPLPDFGVVVVAPDGDWEPVLRSLCEQTLPPVSVTVVTLAPRPQSDVAGVHVVHCAPAGLETACIEAARSMHTDYVAFLQGTDEALRGWLRRLAEAARDGGRGAGDGVGAGAGRHAGSRAGCGAGIVHCGTVELRADGLVDGIALPPGRPGTRGGPGELRGGAYAVRRDLFDASGQVAAAWVAVPRLLVRRREDDGATRTALAPGADVIRRTFLTHCAYAPAAGPRKHERTPELVSVVVPVRDGARTLPAQLRALAAQTYPRPWEVLVVDNGSVDRTRDVAEEARAELPGLRIVEARDRAGEGYARNRGIAAARGDFIAFCDADDVADPGWLAALAQAAGDADLIGGSLDSTVLSPAYTAEQPLPMTEQTDFLPFARGANCAAWKDVLTTIGGWDENYRGGGEDMDLSWRAHLCDYRVGYAPCARMHYRLRDGLSSLARQKWNYGKSGAHLYAAYQHAGFERRSASVVLMNWTWLLAHTPDLLRSGPPRRRWIRYGARLSGFLAGSVRQRSLYL